MSVWLMCMYGSVKRHMKPQAHSCMASPSCSRHVSLKEKRVNDDVITHPSFYPSLALATVEPIIRNEWL